MSQLLASLFSNCRLCGAGSSSGKALPMLPVALAVVACFGLKALYKACGPTTRPRKKKRVRPKDRENQPTRNQIVDVRLLDAFLITPTENPAWQLIQPEDFEHVPIPEHWEEDLQEFQNRIGVHFNNLTHLKCAMLHHGAISGYTLPDDLPKYRLSNRSLEFLGNSIVGMAAASYLYQTQPMHHEGQMTFAKNAIENNEVLSKICVHDLKMAELIVVDPKFTFAEHDTQPRIAKGRTTIEAGAVEALIAAIYLDQGLERALSFMNQHVLPHAIRYAALKSVWVPALELQILLQAHQMGHPVYENIPAPRTSAVFDVALVVQGKHVLTARGSSYKTARVKAASAGYQHYVQLLGPLPTESTIPSSLHQTA